MTSFLLSIVVLLAFCLGTYGWGRLVVHLCYPAEHAPGVAFSVTLGIASWFILGGVLNATHLAYPITIYLLYASGLGLTAFFALRAARQQDDLMARIGETRANLLTRRMVPQVVLYLAVIAICLFLVVMLMPSDTFNMHDDFQVYMARPVRMLQTGTVGSDPFDSLGFDSLGPQAFGHACFLALLPVQFMNAFDAVCCFGLSMLLLLEVARRFDIHWFVTATVLLTFVLIHPLAVNVSALYSSSLMMIAGILAGCIASELFDDADAGVAMRATVPLAMFIASLAMLKLTFAVFAAIFAIILWALWLLVLPDKRRAIGLGLLAAAVTLTASVPWLVVHAEKYWAIVIRDAPRAASQPEETGSSHTAAAILDHFGRLFSAERLYTIRFFHYSVIVALLGAAALLSVLLYRRRPIGDRSLIVVAAACLTACLGYLGLTFGFKHGIRYSIPILIAVLPAMLVLIGQHCLRPIASTIPSEAPQIVKKQNQDRRRRREDKKKARKQRIELRRLQSRQLTINTATIVLLLALSGMLFAFFGSSLLFRTNQILNSRAVLSWKYSQGLPQYCVSTMNSETRDGIRRIQDQTEEGSSILTRISHPFQLDFRRNRMLLAMDGGLVLNWWLGYPAEGDHNDVRDFLRGLGVRYVMWEYRGFGMKSERKYRQKADEGKRSGERLLQFRAVLQKLRQESDVVLDNGQIALFDISS